MHQKELTLNSNHPVRMDLYCKEGNYIFPYFTTLTPELISKTFDVGSQLIRADISASSLKKLNVKLNALEEISEQDELKLVQWISHIFDTDNSYKEPLQNLRELAERVPIPSPDTLPFIAVHSADEMLLNAVLSQNTTADFYFKMTHTIAKKFGNKIIIKGKASYAYPPIIGNLQFQKEEDLSTCKIGYRTKFIPHIANFLAEYPLPNINQLPDDVILKKLMGIKGIGEYSARCFLIYHLKRYNLVFIDSWVKTVFHSLFKLPKSISISQFTKFFNKHLSPSPALQLAYILANTPIYSR